MHLTSCLNPTRVFNKYLNDYVYVPCRHCEACRNLHRKNVTRDIEDMAKQHLYNHFFTLTYSNENSSTLNIHHDIEDAIILSGLVPQKKGNYDLKVFDLTEIMVACDWNDYDVEYLKDKQFIRVGSKQHIQLFVKRLRKLFNEKYQKNLSFDYYIVLEYSPKLHRPHYHGILSHDNPSVCREFRKILDTAWKLGRTNTTLAKSASLSYVAKYINGFTYLPKVFEYSEWRPFLLHSRRKVTSDDLRSDEEIQDVIFGRLNYFCRSSNGKIDVVTFSRSLEDRLFPRCKEFNTLNHFERVSRYRASSEILEKASIIGCSPLESFKNYKLREIDKGYEFSQNDFYISKRVIDNAKLFNVSIEWYVKRIEDYYDYKAQDALTKQYEFQQEFTEKNNTLGNYKELKHLICMYPTFLEKLKTMQHDEIPLTKYVDILHSFGIEETDIPLLDVINTADYHEFSAIHIRMDKDSQKTKKLNEHFINF